MEAHPPTSALETVRELLARERPRREAAWAKAPPLTADDPDVQALVADLASPATAASLAADPYWPKWDAPWWKLLLLHELDLAAALAPPAALDALTSAIASHYLPSFPLKLDELPPGAEPLRHVLCHCALGCVADLLRACGRDLQQQVPWTREWFARYQLQDGGWNCDEQVYLRQTPRSSIVSTVPLLEALLGKPARTPAEDALLAQGARYLLDRQLGMRGLSRPASPIDPTWPDPVFPRFYFYDLLRGLTFVTRWAEATGAPLPPEALAAPLTALAARVEPDGTLHPRRDDHVTTGTLEPEDGRWVSRPRASTFPLLERLRQGGPSAALTARWYDALDALTELEQAGRLR